MEQKDKPDMGRTLGALAELFGKQLSVDQCELYFLALQHWSIEDFKKAAAHLATACEFFPRPYDFEQLRKSNSMSASEAWSRAVAIASGNAHSQPVCSEANSQRIEQALVAIGGWQGLGMSETSQHSFLSKRFMDAYKELADVEQSRAAMPKLGSAKRISEAAKLRLVLQQDDEHE